MWSWGSEQVSASLSWLVVQVGPRLVHQGELLVQVTWELVRHWGRGMGFWSRSMVLDSKGLWCLGWVHTLVEYGCILYTFQKQMKIIFTVSKQWHKAFPVYGYKEITACIKHFIQHCNNKQHGPSLPITLINTWYLLRLHLKHLIQVCIKQ